MPKNIQVFKAALGNENYLSEVNSSAQNQEQFHQTLKEEEYSPEEIIELIEVIKNKKIHSLLIIYLLSQNEYLKSLKGESFLEKLPQKETQILPSRLNHWVHQLDISVLSLKMIAKLPGESAFSVLCSIRHFHKLTKEQVKALVYQCLDHKLIAYWIKNYATMPSAHHILAHLLSIVHGTVFDVLNEMEKDKRNAIVMTVIKNLPSFAPLSKDLLNLMNQEEHLVLALELYLNGHYYQAYINFIEQLTSHLLNTKLLLSDRTLALLFSLNHVSELSKTISKTSEFINQYLRMKAQSGDISPLYRNGQFKLENLTQNVQIKPISRPTDECPGVEKIIGYQKSINYIEYFLMHYHGDSKLIHNLLNEYLSHLTLQANLADREKSLHHLAVLLLKSDLSQAAREGIYLVLLQHPKFHDRYISQQLFLYDAQRTIQHFGLQGGAINYQILFNLCQQALQKIDREKHPELVKVIQETHKETEIELELSKIQGWFSGLIKYIKRCFIYGWSGFFLPKSPVHISPESATQTPVPHTESGAVLSRTVKDLPSLLKEAESQALTQELFAQIIAVLNEYTLKNVLSNEYETRLRLQNLFHKVLTNKAANPTLYDWLMCNKHPFLNNQFILLELALKERTETEIDDLLNQIHEGTSDKLKRIGDELSCPIPEQRNKSASHSKEKGITLPGILEEVSKAASECATGTRWYAEEATQQMKQALGFFGSKLCGIGDPSQKTKTHMP